MIAQTDSADPDKDAYGSGPPDDLGLDFKNAYIRLNAGSKRPIDGGWGEKDVETFTRIEANVIRQHLAKGGNVAVLTGKRSGHFCVDVDPKNGGDETFKALEGEGFEFSETHRVATPSGGFHLNYRYPQGFERILNDTRGKVLGPGIDLKADFGYRVAPPSRGKTGAYVVTDDRPYADAPGWLLDRLRARAGKTAERPAEPRAEVGKVESPDECCMAVESRAVAALTAKADRLRALPEGKRLTIGKKEVGWDEGFFLLACRLVEIARWPYGSLTLAEAEVKFRQHAPDADGNSFNPEHIWEQAVEHGGSWFVGNTHRIEEHVSVLLGSDGQPVKSAEAAVRAEVAEVSVLDWEPIDLDVLWDSAVHVRAPEVAGLFYSGLVNSVHGPSESGKTWLALIAIARVLAEGGSAVLLDFEDSAPGIVRRLRALGVPREVLRRFTYVNPSGFTEADRDGLRSLVERADLVVVDATTEVLAAMGGLSSNSDTDIALYMAALPKWCSRLGPAVVVIDHATKESARNGKPETQGSQHKRASVEGVAYAVAPDKEFGPDDDTGHSWVYVDKDKQGGVEWARTQRGRFYGHLRGGSDGFRIDPPSPDDRITTPDDPAAQAALRKERLEANVVRVMKASGPLSSARKIIKALQHDGVKFTKADIDGGFLSSLVERGFLGKSSLGYEFGKPWVVEYDPETDDEGH